MPAKNIVKHFASEQYYHIYNRGVAKQVIFPDAASKQKFLNIIERHLDPDNDEKRYDGVRYRKFNEDIELLCYCLMANHFHMLVYVKGDGKAASEFMRSVCTAYTMYFNKRFSRVGGLFQGVFKASRISSEQYLMHISRYIHLNPRTYKTYYYSSLRYYLGITPPVWLAVDRVLALFRRGEYAEFLEDYEERKALLDELKYELADV